MMFICQQIKSVIVAFNVQGLPMIMALSLLAMLAIATQLATKGIDLQMVSKISCQDRL